MRHYDVAAYIWPAYTGDEPRSRIFWPEGIGEWQSVKNAVKKFEGHSWPRKPLWGYVNEADPYVMEMEIDAAADHGVNVFLYDWYWFDGRPFLEHCLNNGYLKAKNNQRVKFCLMWANHDANMTWDIRNSGTAENTVLWKGTVTRPQFEELGRHIVEDYFTHPSYYRIDNKPVFQIYDIDNFVCGLGGMEAAKEALEWLNQECKNHGLDGLYPMLTVWNGSYNLSGVDGGIAPTSKAMADLLGFAGLTHYQFAHFANIDRDYREILPDAKAEWERVSREYHQPYYPHVSIGWDNNPRFLGFRPGIVKGNSPEAFEEGLRMAKEYLDRHPDQAPLVTINSWNEWTETSYLEPDDLYGYGYLEAVRRVFGGEESSR